LRSKKVNFLFVRVLTYSRSCTSIVLHKIRAYFYALERITFKSYSMKSSKPYLKILLATLVALCSNHTFSQPAPDYTFAAPSLVSGVDRAVGAVYRFSNVKTGVDALVTIVSAVNATVATFDQTGQGWGAAFQPNITVQSMRNGYVDFRIDFVATGTSTPASQPQVAITAMDIDGYNFNSNQRLWEFEQFDMGVGTYTDYEFAGSDIAVSYPGTAVRGTNVAGTEYGSINTSPNVRFTVFKSGVTTVNVRSGADNQDVFNNVTRQRSFYFARFSYPNSALLPVSDLKSFNAGLQQGAVKLNWELEKDHTINKIDIERASGIESFEKINSVSPGSYPGGATDHHAAVGENYYRLKLYENNGTFFYSKTMVVEIAEKQARSISVSSLVYNNECRINFSLPQQASALLLLTDASGKVYSSQRITVRAGNNSMLMKLNNSIRPGNYFLYVKTDRESHTGKIIVH
jgi:hypothetical protein